MPRNYTSAFRAREELVEALVVFELEACDGFHSSRVRIGPLRVPDETPGTGLPR